MQDGNAEAAIFKTDISGNCICYSFFRMQTLVSMTIFPLTKKQLQVLPIYLIFYNFTVSEHQFTLSVTRHDCSREEPRNCSAITLPNKT